MAKIHKAFNFSKRIINSWVVRAALLMLGFWESLPQPNGHLLDPPSLSRTHTQNPTNSPLRTRLTLSGGEETGPTPIERGSV